MTNMAAIDIGSHTARLLVAEITGDSGLFRPIHRERDYIRLAEGFEDRGENTIRPESVERTMKAIEGFASIIKRCNVDFTDAVATGVVRRAANRDEFLDLIYRHTGIEVRVITGEVEAGLTARGVIHSLEIDSRPYIIFDLGGGSTEFIFGGEGDGNIMSLPLGASILTNRFIHADPPAERDLHVLLKGVDDVLKDAFQDRDYKGDDRLMLGTGGTVTTLVAMMNEIGIKEIDPGRMNGLIMEREDMEHLFDRIKTMTVDERVKLAGLDRGRADVILAGVLVVIRILHFFQSLKLMVSLSDLLEGIIIESIGIRYKTGR